MTASSGGYSLLEVLVAFVVMSLVLSVLVPAQSHLLHRGGAEAQRLMAQDYAYGQLAAQGVSEPIQIGVFNYVHAEWQVSRRTELEHTGYGDVRVAVITIVVEDGNRNVLAREYTILPWR